MTSGGARNRSGPQKDPSSGRSDRLGVALSALPAGGFDEEPPEFPLPEARQREIDLWEWAWTTPQACAWVEQPWRWHAVAMWVRTAVTCEGADATAADKNSLHRFADQIGLTPAGLKENGWAIAADELAEKRTEESTAEGEDDPRARFAVVDGGA